MNKKDILNKCDSYIELFKSDVSVERNNILEFMDFANLHLPDGSNLAFAINELENNEFSEHANRIKDFIKTNGSKSIAINKNILSDKSNAALMGTLFAISSIVFGIGFYFGTEKTNKDIIRTENELSILKDSLSLIHSFDSTNGMTNDKEEITKTKNNDN